MWACVCVSVYARENCFCLLTPNELWKNQTGKNEKDSWEKVEDVGWSKEGGTARPTEQSRVTRLCEMTVDYHLKCTVGKQFAALVPLVSLLRRRHYILRSQPPNLHEFPFTHKVPMHPSNRRLWGDNGCWIELEIEGRLWKRSRTCPQLKHRC